MKSKTRTNSWSVKRFAELLEKAAGNTFGVSRTEEIVNIKVMNNTVVLEIAPRESRRGR
jgi:hypothetical protein